MLYSRLSWFEKDDINCETYAIGNLKGDWGKIGRLGHNNLDELIERVKEYGLHKIDRIEDAPKNTYVIVYRTQNDNRGVDFHWVVRMLNGVWYGKRGSYQILSSAMSYLPLFNYGSIEKREVRYDKNETIFYQRPRDRQKLTK